MDDRIDVDGQRWRGERVQEAWKDDDEAMKWETFERCVRCEEWKAKWKTQEILEGAGNRGG